MRTRTVRFPSYGAAMAIARFPSLVIDCPDPQALAAFYGALLDWEVKTSDGWAEARRSAGARTASAANPSEFAPLSWWEASASARSRGSGIASARAKSRRWVERATGKTPSQ